MKKFASRLSIAAAAVSLTAALGTVYAQSGWSSDETAQAPRPADTGGYANTPLIERMERGSGTGFPAYPYYDPSTHNRVAMSEDEYRRAVAAASTPVETTTASTSSDMSTASATSATTVAANDTAGTTANSNASAASPSDQDSLADRMERNPPAAGPLPNDSTRRSNTAAWDSSRDTRRARADRN
jgi:hypothetical protein